MISRTLSMLSSSRPLYLARSCLFTPGTKEAVLRKGQKIPADVLIFDLEDAVSPLSKEIARANIVKVMNEGGFGGKTLSVRVNALDSRWGEDDLAAIASLENLDAVVIPKVESPETLHQIASLLNKHSARPQVTIWAQIETPRGVVEVERIAAGAPKRAAALVLGTSDLTADLRARHVPGREPVLYALSRCVAAARAFGLQVLDGVHLDLADGAGFRAACEQGRRLGFDGKTLIHPKTVEIANRVFGPSDEEIQTAKEIIKCFEEAIEKGDGIAVHNGKLIENLHVTEARRTVEMSKEIMRVHQQQQHTPPPSERSKI
mmetsp:Transcript_52279/g.89951  ORF Transcript_52279/g.89951 Transcript_52279/m.89951 type:complete len:318 (+) Transcript_52279:97-1050(+)